MRNFFKELDSGLLVYAIINAINGLFYSIPSASINVMWVDFLGVRGMNVYNILVCVYGIIFSLVWEKIGNKHIFKYYMTINAVASVVEIATNIFLVVHYNPIVMCLDFLINGCFMGQILSRLIMIMRIPYTREDNQRISYDNFNEICIDFTVIIGSVIGFICNITDTRVVFTLQTIGGIVGFLNFLVFGIRGRTEYQKMIESFEAGKPTNT